MGKISACYMGLVQYIMPGQGLHGLLFPGSEHAFLKLSNLLHMALML